MIPSITALLASRTKSSNRRSAVRSPFYDQPSGLRSLMADTVRFSGDWKPSPNPHGALAPVLALWEKRDDASFWEGWEKLQQQPQSVQDLGIELLYHNLLTGEHNKRYLSYATNIHECIASALAKHSNPETVNRLASCQAHSYDAMLIYFPRITDDDIKLDLIRENVSWHQEQKHEPNIRLPFLAFLIKNLDKRVAFLEKMKSDAKDARSHNVVSLVQQLNQWGEPTTQPYDELDAAKRQAAEPLIKAIATQSEGFRDSVLDDVWHHYPQLATQACLQLADSYDAHVRREALWRMPKMEGRPNRLDLLDRLSRNPQATEYDMEKLYPWALRTIKPEGLVDQLIPHLEQSGNANQKFLADRIKRYITGVGVFPYDDKLEALKFPGRSLNWHALSQHVEALRQFAHSDSRMEAIRTIMAHPEFDANFHDLSRLCQMARGTFPHGKQLSEIIPPEKLATFGDELMHHAGLSQRILGAAIRQGQTGEPFDSDVAWAVFNQPERPHDEWYRLAHPGIQYSDRIDTATPRAQIVEFLLNHPHLKPAILDALCQMAATPGANALQLWPSLHEAVALRDRLAGRSHSAVQRFHTAVNTGLSPDNILALLQDQAKTFSHRAPDDPSKNRSLRLLASDEERLVVLNTLIESIQNNPDESDILAVRCTPCQRYTRGCALEKVRDAFTHPKTLDTFLAGLANGTPAQQAFAQTIAKINNEEARIENAIRERALEQKKS